MIYTMTIIEILKELILIICVTVVGVQVLLYTIVILGMIFSGLRKLIYTFGKFFNVYVEYEIKIVDETNNRG
jgi:hypothetical protein